MFHWGREGHIDPNRIRMLSQGLREYFEQNYIGDYLNEASVDSWHVADEAYDDQAEMLFQSNIPSHGAKPPGARQSGAAQKQASIRKRARRPEADKMAIAPTAPPEPVPPMSEPSMPEPSMPDLSMSAPTMPAPPSLASKVPSASYSRRLEDVLKEADETFMDRLFRYANERELTDSQLYKKSHIDKRHFGKIKNGEIKPVKDVVIAFILGLELDIDEAEDLLRSAGFTLSSSIKFDLAIKYFIKNGIYDTIEINEVLEDQKLPTLRYY